MSYVVGIAYQGNWRDGRGAYGRGETKEEAIKEARQSYIEAYGPPVPKKDTFKIRDDA